MITEITLQCEDNDNNHIQITNSVLMDNRCYISFGTKHEREQFVVYVDISDLKKAIDKLAL